MIVDDSVVVRGLVARWIEAMPGFEVVATASNGKVALGRLDEAEPDLVLLDLDMPELDGMATLPLLLRARPGLSVVIVSTLTQRNADISLRCLKLGAVDYLPKPSGYRELTVSLGFREELLAKLEGLAPRHGGVAEPSGPGARCLFHNRPIPASGRSRARALLIGASTGGPRAVIEVLKGLGRSAQTVPVLVVQHMPAIFTSVFADHVRSEAGLATAEARDGEPLQPGRVYIAPGGVHMGLELAGGRTVIRLDDGPAVRHCRPALDVLFRDAARLFGEGAAAAVLTGMGADGTEGARALVAAGGSVFAQDEATSVVWGMPGSVARAGLARSVLPLDAIGPALGGLVGMSLP